MVMRVRIMTPILITVLAVTQATAQVPQQDLPPTDAAGADTNDARYQQKVADAIAEYDRGNWAEARALFLDAHALSPSARTWRTLGMTAFELRDYVSALRELNASLDDPQRPLDAQLRVEVEALLDRTRAFVGRFHVAVEPSSATLWVEDRQARIEADGTLLLGLGEHVLRARLDGYSPSQLALRVAGREDSRVELKLEPAASPAAVVARTPPLPASQPVVSPSGTSGTGAGRTLTWVAAASAVAFAGAALGLRFASDSEFDRLKRQCREMPEGGCQADTVDDSKLDTLETLTTASAVSAGAAAIAAVVLFFAEGAEREPDVGLAIEPTQAQLMGRF